MCLNLFILNQTWVKTDAYKIIMFTDRLFPQRFCLIFLQIGPNSHFYFKFLSQSCNLLQTCIKIETLQCFREMGEYLD